MDDRKKWSKKGKIQYVALLLTKKSQQDLLDWWEEHYGELLSKTFAHHVTLMFKPTIEDIEGLADMGILGSTVKVPVVGMAKSSEVQTVVVNESNSPLRSMKTVPHITVATSGVSPVESNTLLEKGFESPVPKLELIARLGFVGRGKELFEVVWER